jgi:hypothetical protein
MALDIDDELFEHSFLIWANVGDEEDEENENG